MMMWISSPDALQRSFAVVNDLITYLGEAPVKACTVYDLEVFSRGIDGIVIP